MTLLPNLYPGVSKPLEGARLRVGMCGLGRQSVPMVMMAERGLIGPKLDAIIVVPMDDEVTSAKETLAMLQSPNFPLSTPIVLAEPGMLARDFDEAVAGIRPHFPNPPMFTDGEKGERGRLTRGCTRDYKIEAEMRAIRKLLGAKPGERLGKEPIVEQWIGISADEVHRMAVPPREWIANRYPLIEIGWTVRDCLAWFKAEFGVDLEGSGCRRCPNRGLHRWRAMRDRYPADFEVACQADEAARHGLPNVRQAAYLLDTRTPLRATDLDAAIRAREGELLGWDGDCLGGSCGI
jgi:hypothetical protein